MGINNLNLLTLLQMKEIIWANHVPNLILVPVRTLVNVKVLAIEETIEEVENMQKAVAILQPLKNERRGMKSWKELKALMDKPILAMKIILKIMKMSMSPEKVMPIDQVRQLTERMETIPLVT